MVQAAARRSTVPDRGASRAAVEMAKLEAAGNDFLVVFAERGSTRPFTSAQVRAVCDRRHGVGADGLVVGLTGDVETGTAGHPGGADGTGGADIEMLFYNADGSEAEMSGNGIRCLVHAAVRAGVVPAGDVRVATRAGVRTVVHELDDRGRAWVRVGMGPVRLGPEVESPLPGTRARLADVGNPHLVAVGDVDLLAVDLGSLASLAARAAGGAVNLEVVRPVGRGGPAGRDRRGGADLELRVLERGVGETLACGTGSCAAAAVARAFGVAGVEGDLVRVDNPGGRLEVRLGPLLDGTGDGEADTTVAELGGPVRKVADVEVDASVLDVTEPGTHEAREYQARAVDPGRPSHEDG